MYLKSPLVILLPAPRKYLLLATLQSFELPGKAVSTPFSPTHREGTKGTN
jgi:hypothetical protein